jgi:hypothetical protein
LNSLPHCEIISKIVIEMNQVRLSLRYIQSIKDELKKTIYYLNELQYNTFDMDRSEYIRNEIARLNNVLNSLRNITTNPENYM